MRFASFATLVILGMMTGCGTSVESRSADATPGISPAAKTETATTTGTTQELDIAIVLPRKRIHLAQATSHFHVLLTNRTPNTVRLWEEWNTWGDGNLSFEIVDSKGNVSSTIRKNNKRIWTVNYPSWVEIEPNEHHIIDVYLDRESWDLPFLRSSTEHKAIELKIIAKYSVPVEPEASSNSIWTGTASSRPELVGITFTR